MKKLVMFLLASLLVTAAVAGAAEMEGSKECMQCGMDRTVLDQSRMLIDYNDGTVEGVCSLHCTAAALKQNKGRQVKSLKVADYRTRTMIDARTVVWVVGGSKEGVMSPVAKWAFASEADAQTFVKENGGAVTPFDQALQAATAELQEGGMGGHAHHDHMGPGSQMVFNPAFGDDVYHTHPAGMWMFNYKYMHMNMSGLQDGTTDVPVNRVIPMKGTQYGYMMTPTSMTMDMHMAMAMYGITDRLTFMAMGTYLINEMEMVMNMGMRNRAEPTMRSYGFGDTEVRGIYKLNNYLVGSLGIGIPTGDINQKMHTMGMTFRAPYDMQLGSGTVDLKPALTYNDISGDANWNWGGQASYLYHIDKNRNGYSLGDNVKLTSWLQRALGPVTSWLRLTYNNTDRISGRDPEIQKLLDPVMGAPTPDADPRNYGGQRLDGFVGMSFTRGAFSIGAEGGVPFCQNLNGLQLQNDWYVNGGVQVMF